jgi:uncharacterized protein
VSPGRLPLERTDARTYGRVMNGDEELGPRTRIVRLDTADCYERLRRRTLGRVAVKLADDIVILPVYYTLMNDDIVFRTGPGTKLSAAVLKTKVAFEVDDGESPPWSVLVRGHAEEIREPGPIQDARELLGDAWPAGARNQLVRIRAEQVTGRSIEPPT